MISQGINSKKTFEQHSTSTNAHGITKGGTLIIDGEIVAGTAGHEMSWKVEEVASISVRTYPYYLDRRLTLGMTVYYAICHSPDTTSLGVHHIQGHLANL